MFSKYMWAEAQQFSSKSLKTKWVYCFYNLKKRLDLFFYCPGYIIFFPSSKNLLSDE